jgi:subfamily B ATP-binding cassette protein MsbA
VLTAVLSLGVLFYVNWKLTSATLVLLGIFGLMMTIAFNRLRPLFRERGAINAEVTGRLTETIGGVRLVKIYIAEPRERLVFARGVHKLFRNVAKTITGTSVVGAGTAVLTGLIGLLAAPLVQIASIGTQVSEAFAGLDRIAEIRAMTTEDEADADKETVNDIDGNVEFQDVSFEYVPDVPVLKHVSFSADAGSTTALVGSSGSGKSTLIGLIMAFNHPKSGRLLVDGKDIANVKLRDYRSHVGVVMQDNFLFDGTVRENIAFSKPGATDEEVRVAAHIAHCDEFVDRFEKGYDTIVGERGVKLSGGQRQRVAIARAVLADPRILILDEATSSLDSESEAMIRDGLRSLRRGRTTFVIAHRLSTIESADQILVIENGEIVERGSHRQLLALGGRYRSLYERQYGAEKDEYINPGEDFLTVAAKDVVRKM